MNMDTLYAPWGTPHPAFWEAPKPSTPPSAPGVAPPEPPPEKYRARIVAVASSSSEPKQLAAATADAELLDQEITAEYGPEHSHTVQIRELRGWVAYLSGDHSAAARWYVHTAGVQASTIGPTNPQTRASVHRAVHIWLAIDDPPRALRIGAELVVLAVASTGADSNATRAVQERLRQLRAQ